MTIKATITQKDGTIRALLFDSIEEYTEFLKRRWQFITHADAKIIKPYQMRQGREQDA